MNENNTVLPAHTTAMQQFIDLDINDDAELAEVLIQSWDVVELRWNMIHN